MLIGSLLCWVRKDEGMIKALLAFVGVFMSIYLMGAFTVWDMNPSNWSEEGRLLVVIMGTLCGLLGVLVVEEKKTYYE
jgi:hypothetical protein